jgi:hypothetical protein
LLNMALWDDLRTAIKSLDQLKSENIDAILQQNKKYFLANSDVTKEQKFFYGYKVGDINFLANKNHYGFLPMAMLPIGYGFGLATHTNLKPGAVICYKESTTCAVAFNRDVNSDQLIAKKISLEQEVYGGCPTLGGTQNSRKRADGQAKPRSAEGLYKSMVKRWNRKEELSYYTTGGKYRLNEDKVFYREHQSLKYTEALVTPNHLKKVSSTSSSLDLSNLSHIIITKAVRGGATIGNCLWAVALQCNLLKTQNHYLPIYAYNHTKGIHTPVSEEFLKFLYLLTSALPVMTESQLDMELDQLAKQKGLHDGQELLIDKSSATTFLPLLLNVDNLEKAIRNTSDDRNLIQLLLANMTHDQLKKYADRAELFKYVLEKQHYDLLLTREFDCSLKTKDNKTLVQLAASMNNWIAVKAISNQTDCPKEAFLGDALLAAAQAEQWTLVESILTKHKEKLALDWRYDTGYYVIHFAVKAERLDIIKLLIASKMDINSCIRNNQNRNGITVLQLAVKQAPSNNQLLIIEYLLKEGADPTLAPTEESPLNLAIANHNFSAIEIILTYSAAKFCESELLVLLNTLIKHDQTPLINLLFLKSSEKISQAKKNQALLEAIENKKSEPALSLLNHGADPNAKSEPYSLLWMAKIRELEDVVANMLALKNILKPDILQDLILRAANYKNDLTVFVENILHNFKINLNEQFFNDTGNYCLHEAVAQKRTKLVALLCKNGADVKKLNKSKKSPLDLALATNDSDLIETIASPIQTIKMLSHCAQNAVPTEIESSPLSVNKQDIDNKLNICIARIDSSTANKSALATNVSDLIQPIILPTQTIQIFPPSAQNPASPEIKSPPLSADKQAIDNKLNAYIARIDSYQDFSHGFWFFKKSRAINREANYKLAKRLHHLLHTENNGLLVNQQRFFQERTAIVKKMGDNDQKKKVNYVERGINGGLKEILTEMEKIKIRL